MKELKLSEKEKQELKAEIPEITDNQIRIFQNIFNNEIKKQNKKFLKYKILIGLVTILVMIFIRIVLLKFFNI